MDPQLSKTGLGMSLRPLVMILWRFEVWSKHPKKRGGHEKKKSSQIPILFVFLLFRQIMSKYDYEKSFEKFRTSSLRI